MIAIDNVLVSEEIIDEQFVCDLNKCKGGCCEDGDAGAPMEKWELDKLNEYYEVIKPYMTAEGISEVNKQGRYLYDQEFGWVTPTIEGTICAYGYRDKYGIIKCAIEDAYNDGKLDWKKPISCHLFPIRIKKSKRDLCAAACSFGKKLKMPVYVFLKESITRKYGAAFYEALEATAKEMNKKK
jgi:Protein of unknown function (DUF3109)